jgi:hypothetical protein
MTLQRSRPDHCHWQNHKAPYGQCLDKKSNQIDRSHIEAGQRMSNCLRKLASNVEAATTRTSNRIQCYTFKKVAYKGSIVEQNVHNLVCWLHDLHSNDAVFCRINVWSPELRIV